MPTASPRVFCWGPFYGVRILQSVSLLSRPITRTLGRTGHLLTQSPPSTEVSAPFSRVQTNYFYLSLRERRSALAVNVAEHVLRSHWISCPASNLLIVYSSKARAETTREYLLRAARNKQRVGTDYSNIVDYSKSLSHYTGEEF